MKILYYDNVTYNMEDFKKYVLDKDYIDGLVVNTVMSQDGKLVIVHFENVETIVQGIEKLPYQEAKESAITLLDDALKIITSTNERILINAIITPSLLNYKDLEKYSNSLLEIINKYPSQNISIFSLSYPLIDFLKKKITKNKIGVLLSAQNASYIDVDFYIFPPILLTPFILNQQYNNGKELMVLLQNWSDLNQTNRFFTDEQNKDKLSRQLIDSMSILTRYPEITYNTVKNI